MKKLKNLIRSRRGIAIEFAIGIMLVSVAISTILLSTAVLEGERKRADLDELDMFIEDSKENQIINEIFESCIITGSVPSQYRSQYDVIASVNDINVKEVFKDGTHIATVTLENGKVKSIQLINSN